MGVPWVRVASVLPRMGARPCLVRPRDLPAASEHRGQGHRGGAAEAPGVARGRAGRHSPRVHTVHTGPAVQLSRNRPGRGGVARVLGSPGRMDAHVEPVAVPVLPGPGPAPTACTLRAPDPDAASPARVLSGGAFSGGPVERVSKGCRRTRARAQPPLPSPVAALTREVRTGPISRDGNRPRPADVDRPRAHLFQPRAPRDGPSLST